MSFVSKKKKKKNILPIYILLFEKLGYSYDWTVLIGFLHIEKQNLRMHLKYSLLYIKFYFLISKYKNTSVIYHFS